MASRLMNMSDPWAPTPPCTPTNDHRPFQHAPRHKITRRFFPRDDVIECQRPVGPEDDRVTVSTNEAQPPSSTGTPISWSSLHAVASEALANHVRSPIFSPRYLGDDLSCMSCSVPPHPVPTGLLFLPNQENIDYLHITDNGNRQRIDTLTSLPTIPHETLSPEAIPPDLIPPDSPLVDYDYNISREPSASISEVSTISLSVPKETVFKSRHHPPPQRQHFNKYKLRNDPF